MPEPILYETEAGFIVVQGDDVLVSERAEKEQERADKLRKVAEGVKRKGISRLKVSRWASS